MKSRENSGGQVFFVPPPFCGSFPPPNLPKLLNPTASPPRPAEHRPLRGRPLTSLTLPRPSGAALRLRRAPETWGWAGPSSVQLSSELQTPPRRPVPIARCAGTAATRKSLHGDPAPRPGTSSGAQRGPNTGFSATDWSKLQLPRRAAGRRIAPAGPPAPEPFSSRPTASPSRLVSGVSRFPALPGRSQWVVGPTFARGQRDRPSGSCTTTESPVPAPA